MQQNIYIDDDDAFKSLYIIRFAPLINCIYYGLVFVCCSFVRLLFSSNDDVVGFSLSISLSLSLGVLCVEIETSFESFELKIEIREKENNIILI